MASSLSRADPREVGLLLLNFYFGASVEVWSSPRRTHDGRPSPRRPGSVTQIIPVIGRPVKSITRVCGSVRAGLAVATARDLVALEPFREASHRALMAAHAASGDVAEAIRAHEGCRRLLVEELGISPSPEAQQLHLDLLRRTGGAASPRRPDVAE